MIKSELKGVIILIPAYNEGKNIKEVLDGCKELLPEAFILVIDDGSYDNTTEVCRANNVAYVSHPFNLGVGAALQTGYKYAVKNNYKYAIQLDADGQHDPKYLPRILEMLQHHESDFIIGSRFVEKNYSGGAFRKAGILIFSKILSFLIREKLTDVTSGYRGMNRGVLNFCIIDKYSFDYPDADYLLTLHRAGFKFSEIPMKMNPRTNGQSQHFGLKPVFYFLKMFLSILIILLRSKKRMLEEISVPD